MKEKKRKTQEIYVQIQDILFNGCFIDTLEKAHDCARKAEETSNFESDEDSIDTRKRRCNKASLEDFPDSSDSICKLNILQWLVYKLTIEY